MLTESTYLVKEGEADKKKKARLHNWCQWLAVLTATTRWFPIMTRSMQRTHKATLILNIYHY
jgi:hypothetical protein